MCTPKYGKVKLNSTHSKTVIVSHKSESASWIELVLMTSTKYTLCCKKCKRNKTTNMTRSLDVRLLISIRTCAIDREINPFFQSHFLYKRSWNCHLVCLEFTKISINRSPKNDEENFQFLVIFHSADKSYWADLSRASFQMNLSWWMDLSDGFMP